ncbi:MAG: hypothetical protein C4527_05995 [Candidatus Omnitrophota bacterium]|jgi:hypothetical protein|nr:MAG: hypothetical protein C4527_05995 [Candidatus Omnitrophota bacterium]
MGKKISRIVRFQCVYFTFFLGWIDPSLSHQETQRVVISEFMANNSGSFVDGDGNFSDWIELHNPTDSPISINSWYLTDDAEQPKKWRFPSADEIDLTLTPGEYLIFVASGLAINGSVYIDGELYVHTNFKLSAEGEDLVLLRDDGQTVVFHYLDYPQQRQDISYGIGDSSETIGYFTTPTPGRANSSLFIGFVNDTKFSVDRGFYHEPFNLEITTNTPDAIIRYTVNGSEPSEENGMEYSGPIRIEKTTVLRVIAYKDGYIPTNVDTQTYLFVDDIIVQSPDGARPSEEWPAATSGTSTQPGRGGFPGGGGGSSQAIDYGMDPDVVNDPRYADQIRDAMLSIPSLSIVTHLSNLFDARTGIYANAQQDGREWERPISLELIHPDGADGFQVNAGLRIRGGVSRAGSNPKHNFRLFFRSEYGDAKLKFPLFEEEGVEEFDKVDLRTAQNFSWAYSSAEEATWLYDVFTRDTEGAMGKPYTRSQFYHLYINGHYWGLYQTEERPEASFGASYLGGKKEDYDTIKADNDNGTIYAADGNLTAYETLWSEISKRVTNNNDYFRLQGLAADGLTRVDEYPQYLDVDTLIDFMLVIYYTGDRDCPLGPPSSDSRSRNLYAVFNRENPAGFQFITHDNEWTLLAGQSTGMGGRTTGSSGLNTNRVNATLGAALSRKTNFNPWWMHNQLMTDNAEYRLRFADHVYQHFFNSGVLTADLCAARFLARKDEIDLAIIAESARWGDYLSSNKPRTKDDDWLVMVNKNLNNYISASPSTRTDIVFNQIKAKGWYPAIDPPVFNQHGGEITGDFHLLMNAAKGTIYYTLDGTDPRLPGGELHSDSSIYADTPIVLAKTTRVKARAYENGTWSALAEALFTNAEGVKDYLRITELHYHPAALTPEEEAAGYTNEDFEFVELYNTNDELTLDLSNVRFTEGITFTFDALDIPLLAPTQTVLLVANRAAFEFRYGRDYPVAGEYEGQLSNGGEVITLVDAADQIILSFEYDDALPWPTAADGQGPSLQVIDVNGNYNDSANWKASEQDGGSPAQFDDGTFVDQWAFY